MEDITRDKVMKEDHWNNRMRTRMIQDLVKCSHPQCNDIAHICIFKGSNLNLMPVFFGLVCIQITYHHLTKRIFIDIKKRVHLNLVALDLANKYENKAPNNSVTTKIPAIKSQACSNDRGHPRKNTDLSDSLLPSEESSEESSEENSDSTVQLNIVYSLI